MGYLTYSLKYWTRHYYPLFSVTDTLAEEYCIKIRSEIDPLAATIISSEDKEYWKPFSKIKGQRVNNLDFWA